MSEEIGILVKDKICLTIEEASRYFGIGEKTLRRLVNSSLDAGFVIQNGVKILIKRQRFEQFWISCRRFKRRTLRKVPIRHSD